MHHALRLRLDSAALVANWNWLQRVSGTCAGAAVKADGYGLGARGVVERLGEAGCRDFFVSTWAEAAALGPLPDGATLAVLHGVGPDDVAAALASEARPVLNTPGQVARWKEIAPGRPCDLMVDTGMNRLGLRMDEVHLAEGLVIDTLMSHLACGDEDSAMNGIQLERFRAVCDAVPARRRSLANSAGICLGPEFGFDLVRPGLALYGGVPRAEALGHIAQVAFPEAEVVQLRTVKAGESVGYGATFETDEDLDIAILNIGYADGYLRSFAGCGCASFGEYGLPVLGRVSMDLIAVYSVPGMKEGDWVEIDYDLPFSSEFTGLSQYELLTGLSERLERVWE